MGKLDIVVGHVHVAAARRTSHQWCLTLTSNNTKTIDRMTFHCFLRPIRRDVSYFSNRAALVLTIPLGKLQKKWAVSCGDATLFSLLN